MLRGNDPRGQGIPRVPDIQNDKGSCGVYQSSAVSRNGAVIRQRMDDDLRSDDGKPEEEHRQPVQHKTVEGWCDEYRENSSYNH